MSSEQDFKIQRIRWTRISSATALSGVAHMVALSFIFLADTPDVSDSRILEALDERIVSIEPSIVPPVVFFEPEPEPEPEPVVEEEIVEEIEVAELEELEHVPTENRVERPARPEPVEVAEAAEIPEPVEIEEPTEVAAAAPALDAIPVSENPDSAVAAVPVPAANSVPAEQAVAAAEPSEEPAASPVPAPLPAIDGESVRRAQERYDRAVRGRLSQLGDAPRRILQGAGQDGPFEVEFMAIVDERGRIIELRLVRSSGVPELDEFAEVSVQRLRRLARVPDELGDAGRRVPISLVYEA